MSLKFKCLKFVLISEFPYKKSQPEKETTRAKVHGFFLSSGPGYRNFFWDEKRN